MTNGDDECGQRRLRDWSYAELDSVQPETVPSALPLLAYGTADVTTSQSLATFTQRPKTVFVQTVTPPTTIVSPAFAAILNYDRLHIVELTYVLTYKTSSLFGPTCMQSRETPLERRRALQVHHASTCHLNRAFTVVMNNSYRSHARITA